MFVGDLLSFRVMLVCVWKERHVTLVRHGENANWKALIEWAIVRQILTLALRLSLYIWHSAWSVG